MKKIDIYKRLGAEQFQRVVFKVEDLKFRFIDKFCPNIDEWYSKRCNCKANKLCSKIEDEEKRREIRKLYNYRKMRFKREIIEKKNRNYHMDLNNASSFYDYLVWNRKVHTNGMVKNIVCIGAYFVLLNYLSGFWFGLAMADLIYNFISLGVNFQCVNLQNYNICRFEEKRESLKKIEERKKADDAKKYALVGEKIYNKLENSIEVPDRKEVVDSLSSIEELEELRRLALEIKRKRLNEEKGKVYVKK